MAEQETNRTLERATLKHSKANKNKKLAFKTQVRTKSSTYNTAVVQFLLREPFLLAQSMCTKPTSRPVHKKTRWRPFVLYPNGPVWLSDIQNGIWILDHLASNLLSTIKYQTTNSGDLKSDHLKSKLFEGPISNGLVFKWSGFSFTILKLDHLKSGRFCLNFKFLLTKWQPFVQISNGWTFGFQIPFEIWTICKLTSFWPLKIWTICNPTSFWPFEIQTVRISLIPTAFFVVLKIGNIWELAPPLKQIN